MPKTLKYKSLNRNNKTHKMKGGVKFNAFGKNPNDDLPFMFFYDIQLAKANDLSSVFDPNERY